MKKLKKRLVGLLAMLLAVTSLPVGTAYAAAPDHIVINQLYGGGGKGKTPFSNSFIELYNPTDSEISLSDYKITYSSNRENPEGKHAGSTWQSDGSVEVKELPLTGSIPAKCSYLIRCAAEDTSVAVVSLDQADMDWNQVIDNDQSVEVILYKGTEKIDAISTRETGFQDIGEGSAPATTDISKQKSLRRTNFSDTDNNAADFSMLVWNSITEAEKEAFIAANRPRSLYDGEWTEDTTGGSEKPQEPQEPVGGLVINEINSSPDDWVELMNTGTEAIDISGYEIRDNSDDHRYQLPEGTKAEAGGLILVDAKSTGKIYDKIWTAHASYDGDAAKASYGRYPDGTGSFVLMPETKGEANTQFVPQIVINEVESNGDVTDWVEIYNAGTTPVDISGWYIMDNDPVKHAAAVTPVAEGTILNPGEYYVFDQNVHFTFGLGNPDQATVYNLSLIHISEPTRPY